MPSTRAAKIIWQARKFTGWYAAAGNPRNVKTVKLPLPGTVKAKFDNLSYLKAEQKFVLPNPYLQLVLSADSIKSTKITDAKGGVWTYKFTSPYVVTLDEFEAVLTGADTPASLPAMALFQKVELTTPESGQFVAEYDRTAGMALKSLKDVSCEAATTYAYTDTFNFAVKFPWLPTAAAAQIPTQYWGDPTSQTNGEGKTKTFAYDTTWRVMKKITDEEGRVTEYGIDSLGRRTSETIKASAAGAVLQQTILPMKSAFQGCADEDNDQKGGNRSRVGDGRHHPEGFDHAQGAANYHGQCAERIRRQHDGDRAGDRIHLRRQQ